ncbi:MAG TPA: peroxidase family protein, partial [Solirubrobacteraceae bacterium]
GPWLQGVAAEREYKNDEMIDDSLRSVLFQIPKPGALDPAACNEPSENPDCFSVVSDLGAIDVERGRDHGMALYNTLRAAYGLPALTSFTQVTGETTSSFPSDPLINPADPINDANIMDFTSLRDRLGTLVPPGTSAALNDVMTVTRRSTLAARLKAIYGNPNAMDSFVGMAAEKHVAGTEFGELQLAMWKKQFQALRDGDRFFYLNDPVLAEIEAAYGITYKHSLSELIRLDSGVPAKRLAANVFFAPTPGSALRHHLRAQRRASRRASRR